MLKTICAVLWGAIFLVASISAAVYSRHYQLTGQPMPNGKGGFANYRDGYYLAVVLFLMSVVGLMTALRCWKSSNSGSKALSNSKMF